ncbi:TetR/AcrR family transcriptional regulator [Kocuria sp.]|uniref:TetR/AcrR family transcriptional regulator n=1 Tax=Kocuria sp. TaxID=1871328 RepID=UPI0026E0210F|nr:TetR/AcrR family transcriptional regulator [Kocuria sp.]MDO5618167.1 TetR/AcrR family transcriptional regulator [Kocuria sp.]
MSLRERKKVETWESIHQHAAQAVLDRGLDAVKVEEIAQAVGISPRTFFNYFPSKDHAVLGLKDPVVPESVVAQLKPGPDLLSQVVDLLDQVVRSARPPTQHSMRHRLLAEHPQLMGLHKQSLHRTEDLVRQALLARLAETGDTELQENDDVPTSERVRLLVLVAGSILRFAWTGPEHVPGQDPTPQDFQRAVDTYHFLNRTDLS